MKVANIHKKHIHIFSDRILIIFIVIVMMYLVIAYQFYKIQIIDHDVYAEELRATTQKEVDIPAIRGMVFDRYGKPLAINKAVYMLKIDPQINLKGKLDEMLLKVAELLEENGDTYIDVIPISKTAPFFYTGDDEECVRFVNTYFYDSKNLELTEELYGYTASQMIKFLRGEKVFNIDEQYSDEQARKIVAMRLLMRSSSYKKYIQVTLAQDIKLKTLVEIEENQNEFPSIFVESESQRFYPYGKELGNILGYTRTITESQYETLKEKGYEKEDVIGQVGIERTQEEALRGKKGSKYIEVDNVGRTVNTTEIEPAVVGNDIFLSIDADLQVQLYHALEQHLTDALVERLQGTSKKAIPLSGREILVSMAKNNQLDFERMRAKGESFESGKLYHKILEDYLETCKKENKTEEVEQPTLPELKKHFAKMLDSEERIISDRELLLAMGEQQSLQFTPEQMDSIREGNYSVDGLLIKLFQDGLLKPDQMDITPCSGSVVVVDPNTGETLAVVSYPSYDNNAFIQDFNKIYGKLHDEVDTRNIETNRALKTAKAPGSTFKMIMAMAGLEENVISTNTLINDTGVYNNAGTPGPHCWIYDNAGHGHGPINLQQALEVSCNYFFYDVSYQLGVKYGNPYGGIAKMTEYAEKFGLGEEAGVELEEVPPNISNPTNLVNTHTSRSLNYIRGLKEEDKRALYNKLTEYFDIGFYSMGNSKADTLEGKIDYYSRPYIKESVDPELGLVLTDDFGTIYDKFLEDVSEALGSDVSPYAAKITEEVMAGDENLGLKARTKTALNKLLKEMVQPGTRKATMRMLEKIPDGTLQNIYLEGYKATLKKYEGDSSLKTVCDELRSRIAQLEAGTFDYESIMADKIIDRIVNVYLDDFFEDVDMNWTTAINIRTAIGQGNNTFTPVQMARYIAGLANGKTVYNLTVLNGIKDNKETDQYIPHKATVFGNLDFEQNDLQTIYAGMHDVIYGEHGTAKSYFKDCPIQLAGKTGTAQANEGESSVFVGFAPYDSPEIVVVTTMYGTDGLGSHNTLLARSCFEIYYDVNKVVDKVTESNHFIP